MKSFTVVLVSIVFTMFLFQNCSGRDFSLTNDAQFRSDCEQDPTISEQCYNREKEFFEKVENMLPKKRFQTLL